MQIGDSHRLALSRDLDLRLEVGLDCQAAIGKPDRQRVFRVCATTKGIERFWSPTAFARPVGGQISPGSYCAAARAAARQGAQDRPVLSAGHLEARAPQAQSV